MKYTRVNITEGDYVSWRFFRSGRKNSRTFHRPAATHPHLRLFAARNATRQIRTRPVERTVCIRRAGIAFECYASRCQAASLIYHRYVCRVDRNSARDPRQEAGERVSI